MKSTRFIIAACAALLLCASAAHAAPVDFFDHDNNSSSKHPIYSTKDDGDSDFIWNDNDNKGAKESWNGDSDNKKDQDDDAFNGFKFSQDDRGTWFTGDPGHHDYDDGDKKHHEPPQYAAGDPGRDKDDDGKQGHHRRDYWKDICDKGGKDGDHDHRHRDCDPGDPAPLPGSFPMFATGLLLLVMYKKVRGRLSK